jgi:hypothetical protein
MKFSIRILAFLCSAALWAQNAPKMLIEDVVHDFGVVVKGEVVDWAFTVRNTGTADLVITDVRPSCGCTVVQWDKVIKAGATGKIPTKLETKDFKGPISKLITVVSNDPEMPQARIFVKATISAVVDLLTDSNFRFNKLKQETTKVPRILVTEEDGFEFKVVKTETSKPWIKLETAALTQEQRQPKYPNAQYEVIAVIGPDAPVGMVNESGTIHTTSAKMPAVKVKIMGLVRPDIMASPPRMELGTVEAAPDFQRMLKIRDNTKSGKFELTEVKSTVPFIAVTREVVVQGEEYNLILKFAQTPPKGDFSGKVVVTTNAAAEEFKVMEVPLTGTVK